MRDVKTVLFPVDFSAACRAASGQIAATAAHFGARLLLLHVIQLPPAWYGDAAGVAFDPAMELSTIKEEKQRSLAKLFGDREDVETEEVVCYGDPAQVITETARDRGADLVMMPSRGCGVFRRFLLGSVTAKVLHDAHCPVWTDVHQQLPAPGGSLRTILCAVDLKEDGVAALEWAANFAQAWEAALHVVHALTWHEQGGVEAGALTTAMEHARTTIAALERKAHVEASVVVRPGKVAEVVRQAALEYGAGLIVIGQGSLHKLMGRLRTSAYGILREAPCPVVRV